jgi:hypothetical protein
MGLKPLGVVREIVRDAGMDIAYAYEDLVFLEHNAFLLQFTDQDSELLLHVNSEADREALGEDVARLRAAAAARNMILSDGTCYTLEQESEGTLRLQFSAGSTTPTGG